MSDYTDEWVNEGNEDEDFFYSWEDDLPDFFRVDQTEEDEEDDSFREIRLSSFYSALYPELEKMLRAKKIGLRLVVVNGKRI